VTTLARRRPLLLLALIISAGAAFRFYGLAWGAPYYHFHIDEHFVFVGALEMRTDFFGAAESPKFFMYSPLPMYVLIGVMSAYEAIFGPLDLNVPADGIRFMVMGRAISATLGTATIPLVFLIARRLAGSTAGLLAAALLAAGVLHLRESHFFTVDISMTFFVTLTWLLALRIADTGHWREYLSAGLALGGGLLSKYSAAFTAGVIGVAHLTTLRQLAWPGRPGQWIRWVAIGILPLAVAVVTFLLLDPLVITHFEKFQQDIAEWVTRPLSGETRPIWGAQFTNVQPQMYWFTNVLWWGLGPAFEIWGLVGLGWLIWRRDRASLISAAFPIAYFLAAGQSTMPFARYGVPLVPALAVSAAVLTADLLSRERFRRLGLAAAFLVLGSTSAYAVAYMNVYAAPDARLEASRYIERRIPAGAAVLVEPSHNIPPTGNYLANPSFFPDYVLWGQHSMRDDRYRLFALDTYRYLYDSRPSDEEKRGYIAHRLSLVDYIVMDDTFLQFYEHLPASEHGVVKQYYEDLFAGQLGFELMRTFKTYPSLAGIRINDDGAELSFRLFDHPRVFIFRRTAPRPGGAEHP
jgi:hypothetical protein